MGAKKGGLRPKFVGMLALKFIVSGSGHIDQLNHHHTNRLSQRSAKTVASTNCRDMCSSTNHLPETVGGLRAMVLGSWSRV